MTDPTPNDDQMDLIDTGELPVPVDAVVPTADGEALGEGEVLPPVPGKHWFAIGEVASLCKVRSHVLRYWEQEFPDLKPAKRRGNRRYYSNADVLLARRIRTLLYDRGYTIAGARLQLAKKGEQSEGKSWIQQELQSLRQEIRAIARLLED
ncbi:MerR family transcriptional regulator [Litorivicinus lipolyticus]